MRPLLHRLRRVRGHLALRLGQISSEKPLSRLYGYDRGTPIDRLYIEAFLAQHANDIRGHVLEVADDAYSRRFGGDRIVKQDLLHVHTGNSAATIIGDLAAPGTLPGNAFDCVVLTQTLQYVFDLPAAIGNIRKALKPGGVLLLSAPALGPICADEWQEKHYWHFTASSLRRLLSDSFDEAGLNVVARGNLYAATAFLHGAAVEEVNRHKLLSVDPSYAVTILARAVAS